MTRQKKFKNRQHTLKKYQFNIEDDKKAKIFRISPFRQGGNGGREKEEARRDGKGR
jgi:hypothetical protein